MNYYMGQGRVYAAIRGLNGKPAEYRLLGNCTRFDILLGKGASRFAQRGTAPGALMRQPGSTPTLAIDLEDFQPLNLATVLYGESNVVAPGAGTGRVTLKSGCISPLPHINIDNVSSVINVATGNMHAEWGYTVNKSMGSIEKSAISLIPDGTQVDVTYTHTGHVMTGLLTTKQPYLSLRFEGVNNARDDAPFVIDVFKVKFDPVDALPLIGDNLSVLNINGKVYYDDVVFAARPEGRFVRIRQPQKE